MRFGGSGSAGRPQRPDRRAERLSRSRLGGGRNGRDRLQDLRRDLVGVALRVRAAILQIALVAVVDEGVRHPDRCAAVRDTEGELGDSSVLVLAGQALVVVWAVYHDVSF